MLDPRGRRRRDLPLAADINITNLVDVAFVLLIIFIITAPILQGVFEVQLPRGESAPITTSEAVPVTVARDGIYMDRVPVTSLAELERLLDRQMAEKGTKRVYLRGDSAVAYGQVAAVFGVLQRLGVEDVGMVFEPVPRRRR